ncbi:MAG TPA: CocE/NonD family hydrolase, partial [Acidimicrobiia bacterium]|nr:CocE/NonD family hydrolase [Acidimicrobiia bacterium]
RRAPALAVLCIGAAFVAGSLAAPSVSAATPPFSAVGSVGQVYVTGLAAAAQASLVNASGQTLQTRAANALGGLLFRNVAPATGYRVRRVADGKTSAQLTVRSGKASPWNPDVYNQSIAPGGYSYLTTRDGTQLAINVHVPTSPAGQPGLPPGTPIPSGPAYAPPYPTLIEYSGYAYADPAGPTSGIAVLANLMGFAVVDVNMRGTGCSGGAFDFFEPLQSLDGYDVIETIARQPWVRDHKVGMMGISYGGISQLFTARLRPPSLAAISPLSVIDATASTLYPGGILNTGFAVAWAEERQEQALPAGPDSGQPYAYKRIQEGDTTCAKNQVLHPEATDLRAKIDANAHYVPQVADPLDPVTFVDKINVPVFMSCQWQDEQTGGHCPELVRKFTGTNQKWFTFTNGAHIDSLDPATFNRWYDFLMLFVARRAPMQNAAIPRAAAPVIYQAAMGLPPTDVVTLPPDPIQAIPTYDAALAAFNQLPRVRVLFENGAGSQLGASSNPGDPYPAFEKSFSSLPVSGTTARTWYLGPAGALGDQPPAGQGANWFRAKANALPPTDYGSNTGTGGLWGNASQWDWRWRQNPAGSAVSYVTAPLSANTAVIGSGSVNLWVRSSTPDVDLLATVSEVRPDGKETFVQNGYIRASERKLSTTTNNIFKRPSTALEPIPSFTAADAAPMPAGQFAKVVVPLYYQGHAYRAGSRIRVTIAAPNGTQPIWSFAETQPAGTTSKVFIAFSPSMPSSVILPVVPNVTVPTGLPACPSLRNQPCRPYQAIVNNT